MTDYMQTDRTVNHRGIPHLEIVGGDILSRQCKPGPRRFLCRPPCLPSRALAREQHPQHPNHFLLLPDEGVLLQQG